MLFETSSAVARNADTYAEFPLLLTCCESEKSRREKTVRLLATKSLVFSKFINNVMSLYIHFMYNM